MKAPHFLAPGVVTGGPARRRRMRIAASVAGWLLAVLLAIVACIAYMRGGA